MKNKKFLFLSFLFLGGVAASANDLYDSVGFETYSTGTIVGQSVTPGSYANAVGTSGNMTVQTGTVFAGSKALLVSSTNETRELLRHVYAGGGISATEQYIDFKFNVDATDLLTTASLFTVRGELVGGGIGASVFRLSNAGVIYFNGAPTNQVAYQSNVWEDFTLELDLSVSGDTGYTITTSQGSVSGLLGTDFSVIDSFEWDIRGASGKTAELFVDNYNVSSIPEPSTYALLFGSLALGLAAIRRRK